MFLVNKHSALNPDHLTEDSFKYNLPLKTTPKEQFNLGLADSTHPSSFTLKTKPPPQYKMDQISTLKQTLSNSTALPNSISIDLTLYRVTILLH